ncbi:hypothetical protein VXE44_23385, partial [Acinetobacter nosocomialis]|uniref:hypothetical protein n=1 Tax=Acinetobacter nosocomialis TaxID=106654 RepID=UPI0030F5F085
QRQHTAPQHPGLTANAGDKLAPDDAPGQVIRRIIVFHFPPPLPVFHPAPNAAPADSVARAVDTGRPAPTVAYGSPFP